MKNDGNENKVNLPEKHDLRKGESGKGGGGGGGGGGVWSGLVKEVLELRRNSSFDDVSLSLFAFPLLFFFVCAFFFSCSFDAFPSVLFLVVDDVILHFRVSSLQFVASAKQIPYESDI